MQLPLSASALVLLGVGAVVAGLLILVVLAVRRRRQVSDAARVPRPPHGAWGPPAGAPRSASPAAPAAVDPARRPVSSATRTAEAGVAAPVSAEPSRGRAEGGAGFVPQPRAGSADDVAAAATARPQEVSARVSPPAGGERVRPAYVPAAPLRHQAGSAGTVAAAVAQAFAVRAAASRAAASGPGTQPPPAPFPAGETGANGGGAGSRGSTQTWPVPPYVAPEPDAEAAAARSPERDGPAASAGFEGVEAGPAQRGSDGAPPAVRAEFGSGGAAPAVPAGLGPDGAAPAVPAESGSGGAVPAVPAGFASGAIGQAGGPPPGGQAAGPVPGPDGAGHAPMPAGDDSDGDRPTAMAEQVADPARGPEDSEQPYTEGQPSNGGQPIPAPEFGSGSAGHAGGTDIGSGAGQAAVAGAGSNGDGPADAADQAPDSSGVPEGEAQARPAPWVAGWSAPSEPVPRHAAIDPAVAAEPVARPEHHEAEHGDPVDGNGKARRIGGSSSAARDRLLAVLLDDPERAVGAVVELEDCLRELDRLSDTMRTERAVLHDALRHLAAAGLRPDQLARLAGMPLMEVEEQLGAERAEQQA